MNQQLLQQPIFQITLPLMVTFVATVWIAQWSQNKRFDDLNRRFDDLAKQVAQLKTEIVARLERIEKKLDDHETRITRVEERTSPIGRR